MPGMDGGQLLTVVKQRWPNAMRIIVSGYSDPVQAVRLTSLAHQYVAKPCDGRELENIIERCFNLQELLGQEPLRKVVGSIGKLPAMPKTYGLLQTALAQPSVTAAEIGDIVNADAAIASKVLQITNSAFFRLRKPMVRIKDAVTYLGFATVRNLVLVGGDLFAVAGAEGSVGRGSGAAANPRTMRGGGLQGARRGASLAGRCVARGPAARYRLLDPDPGMSRRSWRAHCSWRSAEGLPLLECERRITGATHAEIGAYLLGLVGSAVRHRRGGCLASHADSRHPAWLRSCRRPRGFARADRSRQRLCNRRPGTARRLRKCRLSRQSQRTLRLADRGRARVASALRPT